MTLQRWLQVMVAAFIPTSSGTQEQSNMAAVTSQRLFDADTDTRNWLSYGRTYSE